MAVLQPPIGSLSELSKNIKGPSWQAFMGSAWVQPIMLPLLPTTAKTFLWPHVNTRKVERFGWLCKQEEEDSGSGQLADCHGQET